MKPPPLTRSGALAIVLTGGACLSMVVLIGFGYRALEEWRGSEKRLAERRARETVDLFVTALMRDMRGAQQSVLTPLWEELARDPGDGVMTEVAAAFARYPYPESFFAWRRSAIPAGMQFYNRSDRRPPWLRAAAGGIRFPVFVGGAPEIENALRARIRKDVHEGRSLSVFETSLGGVPYQIVARPHYADPYREQLDGLVGFTVNLNWTRRSYFPEVARQVAAMGSGVPFTIRDDRGAIVAGVAPARGKGPTIRRSLPLTFFDPLSAGVDLPRRFSQQVWAAEVDPAGDPSLAAASRGADWTFVVAAVSAGALVLGVLLTARASRASAALAQTRSDFVASVTHDLKTPIAAIRAVGETIAAGRVSDAAVLRDYAQIVVQESKRLGRLIEDLLAYARITDVAEAYAFEPLDLHVVVDEVVQSFRTQLRAGAFDLHLDLPPDLPPIRADRTAIGLALDNIVDNAIRYSGAARWLSIVGRRQAGAMVRIEVADHGVGIPVEEIGQVTRKFFRGRGAHPSGSGLGLAVTRRILADHEGKMAIQSHPGVGTVVTLEIPAAERGDEEADPDR